MATFDSATPPPISPRTPAKAPIRFHEWAGDSLGRAVLASRPTSRRCAPPSWARRPRCRGEFAKRGVKPIAVSVDPVDKHQRVDRATSTRRRTPRSTSRSWPTRTARSPTLYDMIHPNASATATVRSVFIIDPKKVIRATLTYPASTGRNFDEILRVIDSLQLTDSHKVATPANWKDGDDVVIVPSIQDPAELAERFPKGFKAVQALPAPDAAAEQVGPSRAATRTRPLHRVSPRHRLAPCRPASR